MASSPGMAVTLGLRALARSGAPAALVLGLALTSCGGDAPQGTTALLAFPDPAPPAARIVQQEDFLGAEACAQCHQDQYDVWAGSTHGRAGGEPGPDIVIAPFNGSPIRFSDGIVIPRIRGGVYEFVVRQDGHPEASYTVDGVIGGGHMIGGGTQGFVTRLDDGTERFLAWDWSRGAAGWFCNTGSRTNQGWVTITADMALQDCGDWPPIRPLGTVGRYANCQECHGSQIAISLDEGAGYETEYTTLQVNCESCHGPGRAHVDMAQGPGFGAGGDIGIRSLDYLDKDESLGVCFQCHALKDVLKEGYLPGEPLEQYYALKFPVLGDQPYFADGRVRSFAYQANHLASACYLQGPMDCVSCHEPHAQDYWDINRQPLASPFDDGQCTSCHASKAVDPEQHTFHEPGTEGSQCVSCHMPYLQHPELGQDIPFGRSDHTIANPRPVFDGDLGLLGACAQCHTDRSTLQLEGEARERWGELKPHRPAVTGMVDELRARNVTEAAQMLLHPEVNDPLVQFGALSRLVDGYLRPDDATLPAPVREKLSTLATDQDMDIRALALAALHYTSGDVPEVRTELVEALSISENDEALRGRWLLALGFLGDRDRDAGNTADARVAYEKALQLRPGDPRILQAVGQLHSQNGSYAEAVAAFRLSLSMDAAQPLTWVNLGIALAGQGDPVAARQAYEQAISLNPYEALAHFNLGNLHRRADRLEEAAEAYTAAVTADPGLGLGHFELARTYILLERPADALPYARRAVEFRPDHANSRQMLADLEQALVGR
jgi:tetratricopeptide (TPR) repeat protein